MNATLFDLLARSPRGSLALDLALKATLILAAAALAATLLRRSSAASRHLAWCLGLGAALALPAFALALPGWSWRVLPADAEAVKSARSSAADAPAPRLARSGSVRGTLDEIALDDEEAPPIGGPMGQPLSRPVAAVTAPLALSWRLLAPSWSWLWPAWLAGFIAVLSTPIAGRIALRSWARQADRITGDDWTALLADLSALLDLKRRITLLRGGPAAMPMTWGWLRPVVLLPAEADAWDPGRRRDVLLHELAHVKRLDGPTQMMARLACALYWFHPLAWYAARRMRIERERACDDVVLLAGARPSAYAGHLLEIARGLRAPRAANLAALAMARPSQLEGRLLAILDPARRRRGPARGLAMTALSMAFLLLVPLAMLRVGAQAPAASPPPTALPADPAARMTVTGRVLDPSGRPVPNAAVTVLLQSKYSDRTMIDWPSESVKSHEGRCDAEGRFRIEMPRTSSAREGAVTIAATAPGHAIGWADLDPDADSPTADVALRAEQVIRGRLFDVNGQPARGVAIRIESLSGIGRRTNIGFRSRPDVPEFHRHDEDSWPGPAISGDDGRFVLRGLGRGLMAPIFVDDPRFSLPYTVLRIADRADDRTPGDGNAVIDVEPGADPKPIAIALQPARTVAGRVTYADTGRPVPHALIASGARRQVADAEGQFRLNLPGTPGVAARLAVWAQSPEPAPYLLVVKIFDWPRGAVEHPLDFALPRGVTVHGRVVEEGTGRPVAGALVRFTPHQTAGPLGIHPVPAVTAADGTYRVAGPPGPGYVVVEGRSDDYVRREFGGSGGSLRIQPGRERFYAHAYRAVELKPGGPEPEIDLALRPGAAIVGRVVDPEEKPVDDASIIGRLVFTGALAVPMGWRSWTLFNDPSGRRTRDGRFTLHGLDPDVEVPAYFLEPRRKLGASARFSGRSGANGPVTVRLEPCGAARARLVAPDGKPLARYPVANLFSIVVNPGPPFRPEEAKDGPLFAEEAVLFRIDRINYPADFQSDAEGRLTLPALIPGAPYRIVDRSAPADSGGPAIRKEFTVKPGETLDLGDILIARPRRSN